jgi:hypothetical protein
LKSSGLFISDAKLIAAAQLAKPKIMFVIAPMIPTIPGSSAAAVQYIGAPSWTRTSGS